MQKHNILPPSKDLVKYKKKLDSNQSHILCFEKHGNVA